MMGEVLAARSVKVTSCSLVDANVSDKSIFFLYWDKIIK